ncbi:MAG: Tfp pilus assembly protein PilF [Gammaproteobacteria bacterium]|jgi:Tfp pilus assembly protein PilF
MTPQARSVSTRAANALSDARGCLQNGDASRAQRLCLEVLTEHPGQADAQFMLGLIDLQQGHAQAAL